MTELVPVIERVGGVRLAYNVTGTGPPVLLLHGWGGSMQSFAPVVDQLAPRGYALHTLDLPGFGASAQPPTPWGVGEYVDVVLAYMDAHNLAQVAIVGHSFGGRIGLMLAAQYPVRVSQMVLAASAGLRTPLSARHRARNVLARSVRRTLGAVGLRSLRDHLHDRYNRRYASADYLNAGPLRATFLRVIGEDLTDYARRVQAPTVLIWGDQDVDTPLWQGQKLEQLIPDAGLIVLTGAGHFAYLERLGDFVRITDHFLRGGN